MVLEETGPVRSGEHRPLDGLGPRTLETSSDGNSKLDLDLNGTAASLALRSIYEALANAHDLPLASQLFLGEAQKLSNSRFAAVYAIDESTDEVTTVMLSASPETPRELGNTAPLTGGWLEQHLRAGLPHIRPARGEEGPFPVGYRHSNAGIKTSLLLPLIDREQLVGVVVLQSQDANAFNSEIIAKVDALSCRLAPAVQSADTRLRLQRQEKLAQSLNRTGKALTGIQDISEVLNTICQECCDSLEADHVVLHEVEGEGLAFRAAWPPGAPRSNGKGPLPSLDGRASDISAAPSREESSMAGTVGPTLSLPLVVKDLVVGTLEIGRNGAAPGFTRRGVEAAEAFGAYAAAALESSRLQEQLEAGTRQMAAVDEVARILISTLNIEEVYEQFAAEVKKLVDFDRINLSIVNAEEGTYTIKHISGITQSGRRPGDTIPLEASETQRVVQTGQSSITHDLAVSPEYPANQSLLVAGLRSRILVPLVCRGRVIGTITLHSCQIGSYGPNEQVLLERLAQQIASSVENAGLYEETLKEKERATRILAQLKVVLKEADTGLLLVNDQRQVLWMNEKFGEFFGIPDIASVVRDFEPAQMDVLRNKDAACFVDPDAFFAERDRIDADRVFTGYLGDLQLVHPQHRILQEFTTPVHDSQETYIGRLWVYNDITQQKQNEEALRLSEAQERALLAAIPDAMFRISKDGTFLSHTALGDLELFMPSEEVLGKKVESVLPADVAQQTLDCVREALSSYQLQEFEYQLSTGSEVRDYEARIVANGPAEVLAIVRDVTDRKSLEAQFLQAQKLESLGRLAGSIAHDFNNLLGGILGYASLLKSKVPQYSEAYEFAGIIEKATQRGAQLTQQLLTAARRGPVNFRPVEVNEVTQEVVQILSHTLPKQISVVSRLQPDLPQVQGDHTQVHQVLMNLCINAADAMPDGGTLTLTNKEVFLDEDFCRHHLSIEPGRHVQLTVADTGIGITDSDRTKIFDPFFTTKEPGKGTGLGLAVVYAIVKNHNGLIELSSSVGQGSSFIVYLPAYDQGEASTNASS